MHPNTGIKTRFEAVDQLNQQAWDIRVYDSQQAFDWSREAVDLARQQGYRPGLAKALLVFGFCLIRQSKFEEAFRALTEAKEIFESLNDTIGLSSTLECISLVYRNRGDLGEALSLLYTSLDLTEKNNDSENQFTNNYQLGVTYKHLGDFGKALDYLFISRDAAKKMQKELYEAYSINVIGSIYFDDGNYEEALIYYRDALEKRQNSGDKWGEAGSLDNIGFTYLKLNDYQQAIQYCTKSLSISRGSGDRNSESNALLHLAEIYRETGEKEKSVQFAKDSLVIRKGIGNKRGEAEILLFLACLHVGKDNAEAKRLLAEALRIAEEVKDLNLLSKVRFQFYEYYRKLDDYQQSLEHYELYHSLEKLLHKNAIEQKVANLAISHKAEEARKEAETIREQNYELSRLNSTIEAKNRELEIESSLERVRSVALGMNRLEDMLGICKTIALELGHLGVKDIRNVQTAIFYPEKGSYFNYEYYTRHDKTIVTDTSYTNHPVHREFAERMLQGKGECYTTHITDMKGWLEYQRSTNVFIDTYLETAASLSYYWDSLGPVALGISTYSPLDNASLELFRRFKNVFELAYTRYLDIEKASSQAREAQVETSLERVRSKTMAMHSSQDIADTVSTLFAEIVKLGIEVYRCGIGIIHPPSTMELWTARPDNNGKADLIIGSLEMGSHPLTRGALDSWKRKDEHYAYELKGKDLVDYFEIINNSPDYPVQYDVSLLPEKIYHNEFHFAEGILFVFSLQKMTEDSARIIKRFAGVFGQTYRRFLDLQKAEAQAKEARIETALEKVRSRTMAMQRSNELSLTAHLLFEQLKELGEPVERAFIGILNEEKGSWDIWATHHGGEEMNLMVAAPVTEPHVMGPAYQAFRRGERSFVVDLHGNALEEYYQFLAGIKVPVKREIFGERRFENFAFFSGGCLGSITQQPVPRESLQLYERFASVFDLTYTRFLDLQKAEANARDAEKQSSLNRIRAEIASMRETSDLDRITPLIWKELNTLGISFVRCGIFLMDEFSRKIHSFLSTPDGEAIASFDIPYETKGNISKIISNWRERHSYCDQWSKPDFEIFADMLVKQGAIRLQDQYLSTIPDEGFCLHFVPFQQGMLYVGHVSMLSEEEMENLEAVADAFSAAYARYEDFKKLDLAKKEVEGTLAELKLAQQQLIQSEKMASLGELTAGIAHEIQNPLNFVNNFSELSNELLDEMKEELDRGNKDAALTIAEDVKQNLAKITHHGKRADGIVKSMLQHSRTGSGKKELSDINAICDEYLRLAYHGLRAKDKSFQAKFELDLDPAIGKIEIMPQEIGRVVLNLVNNAFYAVTEKKKTDPTGYEPCVSISSRKAEKAVEIRISDNGTGIPQKQLDKIFQPFFSTKPTGQGTGLGLSLSYDIITKAHGGQFSVDSTEGKGTAFIITLPI